MFFSKNSMDVDDGPDLDRAWVRSDRSGEHATAASDEVKARIAKAEKNLRKGFSPGVWLDYIMPDSDPNLEYMENEPAELTMRRYTHNRKKVYGWSQVALLFGSLATLCVGVAGLGTGAVEVVSSVAKGVGLAAVTETAVAIPALLTASGIMGSLAFVAGYFAFRTDIKNDVDIEELQAKRIGRHVAKSLAIDSPEKAQEVEAKLDAIEEAEMDRVRERDTLNNVVNAMDSQPNTTISAGAIEREILAALREERVVH